MQNSKIPIALWALTISVFAIGTTEVVTIGLLPTIAKDLSISISSAGSLVTLYALGVAIGGPLITAFTSHMARKPLLLSIMLLFIAGNAIAAISPDYLTLAIGRVLSGFAHGVFVGIGANIASSLVSEDRRATAIAIMFTGLTVAMVTGVPLGTFIGQRFGWRFTFGGVALLGFSLTVWSFAGVFGVFTYLPSLLGEVTKFSQNAITALLFVYGAFVALGNMVGGRLANRDTVRVLIKLFALLAVVLCSLYFLSPYKVPTILALAGMGFFAFSVVPGMQLYVVQLAEKHLPGTEDVSSSLNIAAFNIGIAIGSYAGLAWGIRPISLLGTVFVIIAFLFGIISWRKEKS